MKAPLHIEALPHQPNTFWQSASGRYYRKRRYARQDKVAYALNPDDFRIRKTEQTEDDDVLTTILKEETSTVTAPLKHHTPTTSTTTVECAAKKEDPVTQVIENEETIKSKSSSKKTLWIVVGVIAVIGLMLCFRK